MWVPFLGWEDLLEKSTATHSSINAWKIPWTEETGRLQSIGSHRVGHNWSNLACMHACLCVFLCIHTCIHAYIQSYILYVIPIWGVYDATAKSLQSCPTRCNPTDGSPPGSPVPGILLARTLEWVAISFSNACKWKVKVKSLSRVRLLATPWTAAY